MLTNHTATVFHSSLLLTANAYIELLILRHAVRRFPVCGHAHFALQHHEHAFFSHGHLLPSVDLDDFQVFGHLHSGLVRAGQPVEHQVVQDAESLGGEQVAHGLVQIFLSLVVLSFEVRSHEEPLSGSSEQKVSGSSQEIIQRVFRVLVRAVEITDFRWHRLVFREHHADAFRLDWMQL